MDAAAEKKRLREWQKPDGACFPLRKKDREMRQPAGGFGGLRHTRKQKQCFVTLPQAEKLT